MVYSFNTPDDTREMLEAIGIESLSDLFASIPEDLRLNRPLEIPAELTEIELTSHMSDLAARNLHVANTACFLGGGAYDHFVPAVVDAIASRGEFFTSYTPYQPEVSQGNLQAMFEYQTMVCQLTGMDVSNASVYEGGSAVAEAVLMSMSVTKRNKVVTSASVHPQYREILETYFATLGTELVVVDAPKGVVDHDALAAAVDTQTACVLLQHPNFFGCLEDVSAAGEIAHSQGALLVQSFDPISLGILKRPGDLGSDIAVAEGQSLGTPLQFGGPYLGILACSEKFVRRLPGRIAGETRDRRGKRCFVLTLQTREQHIRREKATSNICTNQGLFALRAAIYLALLGKHGMREVAELCLQKSHYALDQLTQSNRFEPAFQQPFFKEFVVRDKQNDVSETLASCRDDGIQAGLPLGKWFPDLDDCILVAVTEKRTKDEIDRLASHASAVQSADQLDYATS